MITYSLNRQALITEGKRRGDKTFEGRIRRLTTARKQTITHHVTEPIRRRRSLKATLALSLGGLQFVAVLFVILSTYVGSERALLRQSRNSLNEVSVNIIGHVKNFLNPARQVLDATRRLAEHSVLPVDDDDALESHFFQQLQVMPQLAGIYFADASGRFVYVMRTEDANRYRTKIIPPFDFESDNHPAQFTWRNNHYSIIETGDDPVDTYEARTRPWFQQVSSSRRSVWTDPYIYFTGRKPGITYAVPVLNSDGTIRGILGVDIEINAISGFLSDIWSERRGAAIVINEKGEVVAHPALDLIRQDADMDHPELTTVDQIDDLVVKAAFGSIAQSRLSSTEGPIHSDFELNGERYVAMLVHVVEPDLRWMIGLYAPADNFIGEIRKDRTLGIWIALTIAVLTSIIGLILADKINQPLKTYAKRTKMVSRGEADPEEILQSPYKELEGTGEAFAQEIRRRQRFETAYGRTFDLASRGMAQIAPDSGQFLRVNKQLCDIMGYEFGELEKLTLSNLMPDGSQDTIREFSDTLLQDSEYIEESRFLRKDGSPIWLRVNAILIRDETGKPDHSVVIVDDVSEQKQTEELTARLKRDLSHVARVNLMGEMATGLAHELNQPLSAIVYNVDAALITINELDISNTELTEIMSDIDRQANRAGDIIRALRGIVRKDRGRMSSFDLMELTRQTISLLEPEAKHHQIVLEMQSNILPKVIGNRTQIAQVVVNLLRNAVEAIVTAHDDNGRITIKLLSRGENVEVQVEDSGPGINPNVTLFKTFDTHKPDGMGLGLSICRSIIEANGGRIWNEPANEGGARFCFTLRCDEENTEEIE